MTCPILCLGYGQVPLQRSAMVVTHIRSDLSGPLARLRSGLSAAVSYGGNSHKK